jgi:hypothetical protein
MPKVIPLKQVTVVDCLPYVTMRDHRTMLDITGLNACLDKGWKITGAKSAVTGIRFTLTHKPTKTK